MNVVQRASAAEGRYLVEQQVTEGNLLEFPIFKLSNKEARPTRKGGLLSRDDYAYSFTQVVRNSDGTLLQKSVTIEADVHWGFPTMFAYRVLLAIIDKLREQTGGDFSTARVSISRYEICQRLEMSSIGGTEYELVDHALMALYKLTLVFRNAWVEGQGRGARTRLHRGLRPERLILAHDFLPEGLPGTEAVKVSTQQAQLALSSWVELGPGLMWNLRNGYCIGQDLSYLNQLQRQRGDTAMRLYSYLSKRDGHRPAYTERLMSLAEKLPLKARFPSQVERILRPALETLCAPVARTEKRFLKEFVFQGDGSDRKLHVTFFDPAREHREFAKALKVTSKLLKQK